jgi:hypothetical protein
MAGGEEKPSMAWTRCWRRRATYAKRALRQTLQQLLSLLLFLALVLYVLRSWHGTLTKW